MSLSARHRITGQPTKCSYCLESDHIRGSQKLVSALPGGVDVFRAAFQAAHLKLAEAQAKRTTTGIVPIARPNPAHMNWTSRGERSLHMSSLRFTTSPGSRAPRRLVL
jgi:hypothetical protein